MIALAAISPWYWVAFIAFILACLAIDLGVFHRGAHTVKFKEALTWTAIWCALAMLFALGLFHFRGKNDALSFLTGYIIEFSLSLDNVFVIALIFSYFHVPAKFQHRVLFWGILGALLMRGLMICVGAALIERFQWILFVFGGFLVLTGIKMALPGKNEVHPEKNFALRIARKLFPVSKDYDAHKFITRIDGKFALTPLMVVLLMIETTDLIFALDSIPAIFSVTTKAFIIFTSNVFAILGLRSLYFLLAGAINYFRYLKLGLALVLVFIGVKMLIDPHDAPPKWFQVEVPVDISLIVVGSIISIAIISSIIATRCERNTPAKKN